MLENAAGRSLDERELNARPFTVAELEALIGKRDYLSFLNPRNQLYRELDMKNKPPGRGEALKRMAETPNLIRRPLLVLGPGREILFGFDEDAWRAALSRRG